jgi:predicted amidohydrolase
VLIGAGAVSRSEPVRRQLSIAVAQPRCVPRDARANALIHAKVVREAKARVIVFPELSLTGYELDADAVSPADDAWAPIADACQATGSVALVGAPISDNEGHEFIAMMQTDAAGTAVAYRKMWLGGVESDRFSAGPEPVVVDVDGMRLGLGICKDTDASEHARATAALGIDVFVAGLVHRPEELDHQEARAVRIAGESDAHVAFASFAGSTGGGFDRTAGRSGIWSPDGTVLAQASSAPGQIARTTIGLK